MYIPVFKAKHDQVLTLFSKTKMQYYKSSQLNCIYNYNVRKIKSILTKLL